MCEYTVDTLTSWPDAFAMSRRNENKALSVAFGSVVRSFRERAGYSQEGFAHEAGIDRSFWGAIERGRYNPSLGTIWRVAEALGKRPRDVIAAMEKELTRYDKLKLAVAKKEQSAKSVESSPSDGQSGKVGKPAKRGRKD